MQPGKLRASIVLVGLSLVCWIEAAPARAQAWIGPASVGVQVRGTGGAVADAQVEILYRGPGGETGGPAPRATNAQGQASFSGLAEGVWNLEVSHPDHLSYIATLSVRRGKKTDVVTSFLEASGAGRTPMRVRLFNPGGKPLGTPLQVAAAPRQDPLPAAEEPAAEPAPSRTEILTQPSEPPGAASPGPETTTRPSATAAPPTAEAQPPVTGESAPPALSSPLPEPQVESDVPDSAVLLPRERGEEAALPIAPEEEPEPEPEPDSEPEPSSDAPVSATPAIPDDPHPAAVPEPMAPAIEPEASPARPAPSEPRQTAASPAEPDVGPEPSPPAATEPPAPDPTPLPAPPPISPTTAAEVAPKPQAPPTAESEPPLAAPEPTDVPAAATAPTVVPDPAPVPVPLPELPALPGADASVRSFRDRTCFECKPGEWAIGASAEVAPTAGGCPAGALENAGAAIELLAARLGESLEGYAGSVLEKSILNRLELADRERLGEIVGGLMAASSDCRLYALALPAGARMAGFRYEAFEGGEGGDCFGDQPCAIGDSRWLASPGIERGGHGTLLWAVFQNRAATPRLARFVGYFTPPSGWRP